MSSVDRRIDHVRGHDCFDALVREHRERNEIVLFERSQGPLVDGNLGVRVPHHVTVTGKMLADRGGACASQAAPERACEMRHRVRIAMESAIADDRAAGIVEIEHRGEAEIDSARRQFPGDARTDSFGFGSRFFSIAIPAFAERAHRRQRGESLAKALHASALVIDTDQRRRVAQSANRRRQRHELARRGVVAREQDDSADRRVADALAVLGGEFEAFNVEHHRPTRNRSLQTPALSPFTPSPAASRSNAFISRTASRRPTNTARLTIA